jgi:hypothetical protein
MPKLDLDNLETAHDIAARTLYSLNTIRQFVLSKEFPKCVAKLGNSKFYSKAEVKRYFEKKVDHRFRENRRRKV